MSLRRFFLFFAFAALFLVSRPFGSAIAGDEWLPIDPADLKMTSEPKAPGAPAIYLYRQVDRKDQSRAGTEYNYRRVKILTEEGRHYADIEIPYYLQDASVRISNIRARAIHPDGSIVNFDGKVFDKIIEKKKGLSIKAKTLSIPDVPVGSIVEYHFNYDFEDNYIFNSHWSISDELYTRQAKFTLVPFPRWAVRWAWPAGLPKGSNPPKIDPDNVVRYTAQDIPAFHDEDFMPPENELKFRVIFIYSKDTFEEDPAKYWKHYGKKQYEELESFLSKRKELQAEISQVVSPSDSNDVKLRKIYARSQQIKNLTFEDRKTSQEEKRDKLKKIDNVADVLKSGYGSSADITWLFVGLARAAGFDASGGYVSTRNDYFFNDKRMDSNELNSNIAIVKVDGKEMYFDPGSPFMPYGQLPWYETAVKGMRLTRDGGDWIQTPLPDSAETVVKHTANFNLTDDGSLEGKTTLTFTGIEAAYRRRELRNDDDEARKKYLEEIVKNSIPAASEVELKNQPDWTGPETPLQAEFGVKIPGWASSAGRRAALATGVFSAYEKHMFEHSERVNDVYFHYPVRRIDEIKIELPQGWKVDSLPKPVDQDAKAAEYILKVEQKPGLIQVTRSLRRDLIMVPKDMYPSLRNFFQAVKSGDEQQIVLLPGAAAASK